MSRTQKNQVSMNRIKVISYLSRELKARREGSLKQRVAVAKRWLLIYWPQ